MQVCVPGLHISLGVFKKFFDELENQCFELDKKVQLQLAVDSEQLPETVVDEKILALRAAQEHRVFTGKTSQLYEEKFVCFFREKLADDQLELAALEKSEGAVTKQLDVLLKEMNVERQAYHGKSFIGNHVHTCYLL